MKISARNRFEGTISSLKPGAINAEVELTTAGGEKIVAVVTRGSVDALGLALGKRAVALVKAPSVMLVAGDEKAAFSARNQLRGTITRLIRGAITAEVVVTLPGGSEVYAVITSDAATELELKDGCAATALFKASQVILGVPV